MSKVTMKAIKTFYNNGRFTVEGTEFSATKQQAAQYEARELAVRTGSGSAENSTPYEEQTVSELRTVAKQLGLTGYYNMNKTELIDEIRRLEATELTPNEEGAAE
jgi:hypothetical protein